MVEPCTVTPRRLPHTRGDEPPEPTLKQRALAVCPTRVGMNRGAHPGPLVLLSLPHTRGDEPAVAAWVAARMASAPHAWG